MMDMYEAARREAERLRIVVQTMAYAHPTMTLDEALPIILAAEKRAAELDAPSMPETRVYPTFVDMEPETGALFIDLSPDIQEPVRDGKPINGIKEFCARTGWGLKESKEAVLHWQDTRLGVGPTLPSWPASSPATPLATKEDIALWIDTQPTIMAMIDVPHGHPDYRKISGIREVRARCPYGPGLKEAKDGVEHWIATRGFRTT